ncbi:UNVERIFIED_CONTAM: hypothetical protein K2H54_065827 [Gekko kuhli]
MKGATVKIVEKKPDPQTPSDKDWSQSGEEDSEDNRKSASIDGSLKELIADGEVDSANESSQKCSELQKGTFNALDMVDPITSDKSLQIDVLSSNECPSSTSLPFVPNKNITELLSSDYLPDGIQNEIFVETKNSVLEYKNQSSPPKSDCTNAENSPVLSSIEDKAVHTKTISELGPGSKLLGNKKEVSGFHQHETSSETERNTWAFFSFDLVDEQPHASSDKNEPCLTWPECSSNVKYEQRSRKARKPKQVFSEKTTKFNDKKSNKELKKGGGGAVLNEGDNRIDCPVRSPLSEIPGIEGSNFPTEASNFPTESVTEDNVPTGMALLASPTGKGRCRRIFNLAPNFDLPRQILVRKDEKVLKDADVLIEQEKVSDDNVRGEDKQSLGCHESAVHSSYAVAVDSLCPDAKSLVCNLVPIKLTESMDSSKNVVASPVQICTSASLPSDGQVVTPIKTVETNTDRKREKIPWDISTTQPDILYSVKATTECPTNPVAEQCKNMYQINKPGATKCSHIEDDQGLLSTKFSFLKLPLSLGFALQLVKLFGSPAVPLDTLLPDDYVVPLDWTISKEIYLRWKASVEKNQKKNQSKGYDALPAGAAALEDSKEVDGQEKQEPSDANPQMFQ